MSKPRGRMRQTVAAAAAVSFYAFASTAVLVAQQCNPFYCWDGLDGQGEETTAHSGTWGEPDWGSDWSSAGHIHSAGYQNWHDYGSPEYLEMSGHNHWNC